jgi:glycosyltransferase involved in cell wall biosynthesis
MKIGVIFHDSIVSSGATQSMLTLFPKWQSKGVDIIALIPKGGNLEEELNKYGIKSIRIMSAQTRVNLGRNPLRRLLVRLYGAFTLLRLKYYTKNLTGMICEEGIDVLYSNTTACLLGYYLQMLTGLPHIWHIREFGDKDQNCDFVLGHTYLCRKIDKANLVITISKSIYDYYKKDLPSVPIVLAYNDISETFNSIVEKDWSNTISLLSCGSLNPGKGHLDVIRAIALLRDQGIDVLLKIAGSGKIYEALHKNLISELSVHDRVEMLGQVSDIKSVRRKCHIAVIASRMEAFGRVTVESMLSGMAVIGADSGGTVELIKDNETGLLFEVGDVYKLASCIKRLVQDRVLARKLANNGYSYSQRFIQGNCADVILSAIKENLHIE